MNTTINHDADIKHLAHYYAKPVYESHIYAPLVNEFVKVLENTYGKAQAYSIHKAAVKLAGK